MGAKPTVLHIGHDEDSYLCNAETQNWADKYLTDEFARKLPKCPDCMDAYEVKHGSDMAQNLRNHLENYKPAVEIDAPAEMRDVKTLRMYLNT
jgi:peptide subunit release factor 1 (eRF1)